MACAHMQVRRVRCVWAMSHGEVSCRELRARRGGMGKPSLSYQSAWLRGSCEWVESRETPREWTILDGQGAVEYFKMCGGFVHV